MYGLSANFTVTSYPADNVDSDASQIEQEFPYWDQATHDEQKEKAYARYEQEKGKPGRVVTLCRLSMADLEEGDPAPTLLRRSDDPSYEYEGFPYI